jgi:hypothetical protein
MRLLSTILLTALMLQGCGTTANTYVNPQIDSANAAVLVGKSDRRNLSNWTFFVIEAIDGQSVSFFKSGAIYEHTLTPGIHKILVRGSFNTGWGRACPCESRLVLVADFAAGQRYRVNGEVRDNRMVAWIENATTSQPVSNVAEEPYVTSPKDTGYVIVL